MTKSEGGEGKLVDSGKLGGKEGLQAGPGRTMQLALKIYGNFRL
jgi:hypothetical protein